MPARPDSGASAPPPRSPKPPDSPTTWVGWSARLAIWGAGAAVAGILSLLIVIGIALAVAYPNLPDTNSLTDYRPKLPLRVFTADGVKIGEFGEERRNMTPIQDIPAIMKEAVLSAEDAHFYQHGGVDYAGVVRAALANLAHSKSQGASNITMQVARNVYLSTEKTYTRKIYEILLTFKLEHELTKDQILQIYMNQIYLGNRAYGFASACQTYFGKPLKDITLAEAAMLAGLPKAPSAYNPIANPARARARQLYVLDRMVDNGYITAAQADAAKKEELDVQSAGPAEEDKVHAEYVAEMVRQLMFAHYGESAYTRGLDVYTTLNAADQEAAYRALRGGIMNYERRQIYRGPEQFIDLPSDPAAAEDASDDALVDHPDEGNLVAAVVLEASPKKVVAMESSGDTVEITGDGLYPARSGLADKAPANVKIRRGAIIRIVQNAKGRWEITQVPEVEGAFVAMDPGTGDIKALVGGFDFNKSKFNHVTQAWRQPGSSFKPFIYSAALEKGFTPATIINDAPLFFDASVTGGQPWEPKNFENTFEGPVTLRRALAKSINTVAIRVLQAIGPRYAQEPSTRRLPIDGVGLALLVVGVGALQIMLDKGKELDWFASGEIVILGATALVALFFFVAWELTERHPVVDLTLFRGRNFATGTVAISLAYSLFFAMVVLMPLWLQQYMGYTSTWAGLVTAPIGILALILSPLVGRILPRTDPRLIASFAFLVFAATAFLRAGFNTDADVAAIVWPQVIQGAAMATFFVPLTAVTLSGLGPERIPAAAGLSNFFRITAGAFGASVSTTMWDNRAALHHAQLTERVTAFDPAATLALQNMQSLGLSPEQAMGALERELNRQAYMLSVTELFWLAGVLFLVLTALIWLARPIKSQALGAEAAGAH